MKQTITFQRASIFRRICSALFDFIIFFVLLMLTQAYVFAPIISSVSDYNVKYQEYYNACLDSKLYMPVDDQNVKYIYEDKQFIDYYMVNNIGLTLDDYNKAKKEATPYTVNNVEYPLFIESPIGSGTYIENVTDDNAVNEQLNYKRDSFYLQHASDIYVKFVNHENNKDFAALATYLSGLISLSYIFALIFSTLFTYLLFPMIFKDRATLGKKMFHFTLISLKDAKTASRFQVFARFVYFAITSVVFGILTFGLAPFISLLIIPVTSKRQTLHDLMARTAVVNNSLNTGDERDLFSYEIDDGLPEPESNDSANVVDAEFVDVEITPEEVYGTNVNDENNEKTNDSRDGE